jgi:site-specific DNA recombinase
VARRITDANFNFLLEKTQKEQAGLKAKVEKGRKHLADEIRLAKFLSKLILILSPYRKWSRLQADRSPVPGDALKTPYIS